jgi:hypothetical protein
MMMHIDMNGPVDVLLTVIIPVMQYWYWCGLVHLTDVTFLVMAESDDCLPVQCCVVVKYIPIPIYFYVDIINVTFVNGYCY